MERHNKIFLPSKKNICMNSGYHKNLVFTAACIGMCFFRCFNDYIGFGTAFSRHKTGIKRTANYVTGNLSSHRHAGRFVDFRSYCGPFRTQSIVGAQLHHRIIGIGRTDIFRKHPAPSNLHRRHRSGRRHP